MTASTTRTLATALAVAALTLTALSGTSHAAAAITGTFQFEEPLFGTVDFTDTCLGPGATGTLTGTVVGAGGYVVNDEGAFNTHGTVTTDFRIDYADGRYGLGTLLAHTSGTATHFSHTTTTEATQGSATLYEPDGQPVSVEAVHAITHLTWTDRNDNNQPDPDEFTGSVDHFRITCS